MSNRDYDRDREYDRRDRGGRAKLFDRLEDGSTDRPIRDFDRDDYSADRGGFAPVRRPYPDRAMPEEFPSRYGVGEDRGGYSDYPGNGNVTIYSPKAYADVQDMIDKLRKGESIIVNLEGIESESAQRILDFLSGASYALGGSMRRVKEMHSTFLITPSGTGIMDTNDDRNSR